MRGIPVQVVEANLSLLVDAEVYPLDVFEFNVHQHLFGKFLVQTNAPLVAFAMNPIVDVPIFAHSAIRITSVKDTHVTPPFSSVLGIRSTVSASRLSGPMRSRLRWPCTY
jgi:hypothetical protein